METISKLEAAKNLLAIVQVFGIKEIGLLKCKESVDEAHNKIETLRNLNLIPAISPQAKFNAFCFLVFTHNNNIKVIQN